MSRFGNGSVPFNFINLNLVAGNTLGTCHLFLPRCNLEIFCDRSLVIAGEHKPSVLSLQFRLPCVDVPNYFGGAPFCSA